MGNTIGASSSSESAQQKLELNNAVVCVVMTGMIVARVVVIRMIMARVILRWHHHVGMIIANHP